VACVSTQVTIVGGGSYQWGPELMADLFGTPALAGMHLVLEDIDPAPLTKMEALARKLSDVMDAKATVATTTDLHAALDGADFVIVCISTGGFRSMAVDLDVPAAHGITQTVGDTVGPGGINRALRNVPVLVGVAKAMEEQCPDAWLFNITNPMTCLTRAVCRETSIKTVGLCHEVGNFCMDLAIALGRPAEAVSASVLGINHFPVVTALEVDGADGLELLRELTDEVGGLASLAPYPGRPEADAFSKLDFAQRHMFKLMLLDRWGTFPAAGDRHIAEFVSFALTPESDWGAAYNIGLSPISRREEHQAGYVADVDAWLAGTKDLQTWQSGELPSPMIQAMLSGDPFEGPVNIPNAGQGIGLPDDVVLESICVIDADGIRGRDRSVLPRPYDEIVRRHVATQELTIEAALRGDRTLAGEAFALDPLAGRGDLRDMETMVNELLDGTAEWLPQFA
jgi:alpha-galactosidase/6-phospho-beta-glucosidase family protein